MAIREPGGASNVAISVTTSAHVLNWRDEKGCRGYFEVVTSADMVYTLY